MTESVRSFLALELPEQTRTRLAASREQIRSQVPDARWVKPEGQHLTLKFLGEVTTSVLDGLITELAPALVRLGAVAVRLAGAGFFPSPARARVAWIGGSAEGVAPVVTAIEDVAERHGFARERRPWALHLTQARLRKPWPDVAVELFLRWGESLDLEPFVAREVVLYSSLLTPAGAVYTALERMPLS
jgi:2'-5' RNA ligase